MRNFILSIGVALAVCSCDAQSASNVSVSRPTTYTKAEFSALVVGKTSDQIIDTLGRPEAITDNNTTGQHSWLYRQNLDPLFRVTDDSARGYPLDLTVILGPDDHATNVIY